jgi:RNA polymerase sigma-70 factor (ECF subfamily)
MLSAPVFPTADDGAMAKPSGDDLIEAQIPALRRYAYALTRDRTRADDLVQDCLERALTHWHRRRDAEALRPWLFSILRNGYLNSLRGERRRGALPLDDVVEPAVAPEQGDGLAVGDILAAVDRLPEEQRSLVLLVGVEDLSYAEAAAALAIPQGTVMSRLSRARQRLRALLDGESVPFLRRVK